MSRSWSGNARQSVAPTSRCLNENIRYEFRGDEFDNEWNPVALVDEFGSVPTYAIRVRTGSQTSTHTEEIDALNAVSIVLMDPVNDSVRIPLERASDATHSLFQPGEEDRFDVTVPSMSEVSRSHTDYPMGIAE